MWQYVVKVGLTSLIVIAVSELSKRSSLWGALLASLPVTSLLAFIWLYIDTGDAGAVAALSQSIFWLVLASLPLFLILPLLLRLGTPFWASFGIACLFTVSAYFGLVWVVTKLGIRL
jgi:hypothetical protein